MTEEQVRHARALLTDPENSITSIAKLLGVSRTTVYKYAPELAAGLDSLVPGRLLPHCRRHAEPLDTEPRGRVSTVTSCTGRRASNATPVEMHQHAVQALSCGFQNPRSLISKGGCTSG